jgi:hypothetical protein
MTKWKILNVVAFLLLVVAIMAGCHSFLYPAPFSVIPLLKQIGWKSFLLLYTALLLLAFTFSFILSSRYLFQKTFFKTLLTLHIAAIMSVSILAFLTLTKKRSALKELFPELEKQAARDIQADSIRYIPYEFPIPDSNDRKRDSIMANYSIYIKLTFIIGTIYKMRDLYYEKLTQQHLDKRNGKNWKMKMQKELGLYERYWK